MTQANLHVNAAIDRPNFLCLIWNAMMTEQTFPGIAWAVEVCGCIPATACSLSYINSFPSLLYFSLPPTPYLPPQTPVQVSTATKNMFFKPQNYLQVLKSNQFFHSFCRHFNSFHIKIYILLVVPSSWQMNNSSLLSLFSSRVPTFTMNCDNSFMNVIFFGLVDIFCTNFWNPS